MSPPVSATMIVALSRLTPGVTLSSVSRDVYAISNIACESGGLRGQAGQLPCTESAPKRPHALEAAIEEHARQTGAGGLARSRTVQDDFLVAWHRIDVPLEITGRDTSRSGNHLRRPAERVFVAQIDDENILWLRIEPPPELLWSDAVHRVVALGLD